MSRLLRDVQDQFKEGNLDLLKRFRHYINAFLHHSEISAQEVGLHLEGTDMSKCSVGGVFINTSVPGKRVKLLKSKAELEA